MAAGCNFIINLTSRLTVRLVLSICIATCSPQEYTTGTEIVNFTRRECPIRDFVFGKLNQHFNLENYHYLHVKKCLDR